MVRHTVEASGSVCLNVCEWGVCLVWVSQTHLFPSRMDLIGATGQGADRFIRVIISGCPVSQSAVVQLPGLQWQPWWAPGGSFRCAAPNHSTFISESNLYHSFSPRCLIIQMVYDAWCLSRRIWCSNTNITYCYIHNSECNTLWALPSSELLDWLCHRDLATLWPCNNIMQTTVKYIKYVSVFLMYCVSFYAYSLKTSEQPDTLSLFSWNFEILIRI